MKKILALTLLLLCLAQVVVFAHPGRTASDGCHYCRTNCEKWGVPYGERHCH
ncbi:MAG: YHYH domain-containing protein [Candidatus Omnitrophota bacterium]